MAAELPDDHFNDRSTMNIAITYISIHGMKITRGKNVCNNNPNG